LFPGALSAEFIINCADLRAGLLLCKHRSGNKVSTISGIIGLPECSQSQASD
jgi:hypothetical protein